MIRLAPFLLCAGLLIPPRSVLAAVTASMEERVSRGIDLIYSMEFDKSEEQFKRLLLENPRHPYGHFAKALGYWARYMYDTEQDEAQLIPPFEKSVLEALEISKSWIKSYPQDAQGLLCLGGIYGIASRLDVIQKHWLRAYFRGRSAISYTRLALKKNPSLYDAYLGIGMYDYYSDALPRFIRILSRIVLRGSRRRGIEELKLAAQKGTYTQIAARLILIEIYTEDRWGAKNPLEALQIVREVRQKFPTSSLFHITEIICLYEAGRLEEARKLSEEYVEKIQRKAPTYRFRDLPKAYVALGTTLWAQNLLPQSKRAFQEAAQAQPEGKPNRWATWAYVRLGELEDLEGNRDAAKSYYKKVFNLKDYWGFNNIPHKFFSHPYIDPGSPGPIPPP